MSSVDCIAEHAYTLDSFFTPFQCELLIHMAEQIGFEEARLGTQKNTLRVHTHRNNARILWDDRELAKMLWETLQQWVPQDYFGSKPIGLNERFRFYRYTPGQYFNWHADGSFQRPNGEQSLYTVLLYLSEPEEGGETLFKDGRVLPVQGRVCWFLHKKLHKGSEVRRGTKYILRTDVMYTSSKWK